MNVNAWIDKIQNENRFPVNLLPERTNILLSEDLNSDDPIIKRIATVALENFNKGE